MNKYTVVYTELVNGKEAWFGVYVYARTLDHAADKWSYMRLPHQQTESISHETKEL